MRQFLRDYAQSWRDIMREEHRTIRVCFGAVVGLMVLHRVALILGV